MSTFPDPNAFPANGVWNTVSQFWNNTNLYWSYIAPKRKGEAGDADFDLIEDELILEQHDPYKRKSKNRFIKLFMTVHNQFLNEEQCRNVKIAKAFPTYTTKFEIKPNILLKENQTSNKIDVKVVNVKVGLETI